MLGYNVPRGLQARSQRPPMQAQTASAPGRGLGYRPLNPLQSVAGGGLRGIGQLLMQLGAGRPQDAGQAFSSGVDQFDATQRQNAADAQNNQLFDLEMEDRQTGLADKAADKEAAAQQKAEFDGAVDKLVASGAIDSAEGAAMKSGVGKYGDFASKPEESQWEIKTLREGNQDVTYWVNKNTRQKEKITGGAAFAPRDSGGGSLSIAAPVWGMDPDGKPVLLQMSPDGKAFQTVLPAGVTPVRPNVQVDTGTGTAMVSPITGSATTVIPKDVAGKQAQEEIGTAAGKVAADLPNAIAKAEEATALIESLKTHPGRQQATGFSSVVPAIPGGDTKDFNVKLDQLKGTVFLQAYSQLKGGGAITEVEGQKAEQAIARLNTAQSEGEFLKSLDELKGVINEGIKRMKARAAGGGSPYATDVTANSMPTRVKVNAQGEVIP